MDVYTLLFMALIVLFAYTIGTVAGFGPTILALPLMLFLHELYFIRPMLTLLGAVLAWIVCISTYKNIQLKIFFIILLVMGAGLPIGVVLYSYLNREILLISVGIFTLLVSIRGIFGTLFHAKEVHFPRWLLYPILFLAGVLHGAFTTGGPLLVIYSSQVIKEKKNFRATQVAIWSVMNLILVLQLFFFVPVNSFQPGWDEYKIYFSMLPILFLSIVIGHFLEKKVSQIVFQRLIYILLFISACTILIANIF